MATSLPRLSRDRTTLARALHSRAVLPGEAVAVVRIATMAISSLNALRSGQTLALKVRSDDSSEGRTALVRQRLSLFRDRTLRTRTCNPHALARECPSLVLGEQILALAEPAADAPITKAVIGGRRQRYAFPARHQGDSEGDDPAHRSADHPVRREELAASGIEDVVFVSRWDKKVLEDHFDQHPTLEDALSATGKQHYLEATRRPVELVNAAYIRQRGPYGNGTPALNAGRLMGDAPFVVRLRRRLGEFRRAIYAPTHRSIPLDARRHPRRPARAAGGSTELRHDRDGRESTGHPWSSRNPPRQT